MQESTVFLQLKGKHQKRWVLSEAVVWGFGCCLSAFLWPASLRKLCKVSALEWTGPESILLPQEMEPFIVLLSLDRQIALSFADPPHALQPRQLQFILKIIPLCAGVWLFTASAHHADLLSIIAETWILALGSTWNSSNDKTARVRPTHSR